LIDYKLDKDLIKKREIQICKFYDWNISFLTYYDSLREYLHIGLIDLEDEILLEKEEKEDHFSSTEAQKSLS